MRHILDTNVFLAVIYEGHGGHKDARAWFDENRRQGWGIAVETYLSTVRLLMNPATMGGKARSVEQAFDAIEAALAGAHPGRIIFAAQKPNRALFAGAQGHKQVMDIWLVQLAKQERCKLVTMDAGILAGWPEDTVGI